MTDFSPLAHDLDPSSDDMIAGVARYWASLPRTGAAPDRAALDAAALAPVLPFLFVAELVTPRVARLRVVGHRIEDLMGMDLRGMPLTALMTAPARDLVAQALDHVARGGRATLTLRGESGFGQPDLNVTMALMPLSDGQGNLTRVLGVLDLRGATGRKPRRLAPGLAPLTVLPPLPQVPRSDDRTVPHLRVIRGGRP